MKRFVLQAVNPEDHLEPARSVFDIEDVELAIIGTAFMTASGLHLLSEQIAAIADRTKIFVGIRNGITTVQSIQLAIELGCQTYMVDTGSRQRIFHPKMYYARSAVRARLLLGSANLTMGGLRTNIEASVMQELDPAADAGFLADLEGKLDGMIADYPNNVIRAVDSDQLDDLQRAGRLLDERKVRLSGPSGSSVDRSLDNVPIMALRTTPVRVPRPAAPVTTKAAIPPEDTELLWTSKPLKRAHINLPNRAGTNPKGALSLTGGLYEDVNPREYFRNSVFEALDWEQDERLPHKERAHADVRIIVKGINYGVHSLRISHDTRTDTANYRQNNYTTSLHWGDTAQYVAHEDILGRTLRLFRKTDDTARFTLEID